MVRRVAADGRVETVVGSGFLGLDDEELPASQSRLAVPAGLALSPDGRLHLVDLGNQQGARRWRRRHFAHGAGRPDGAA